MTLLQKKCLHFRKNILKFLFFRMICFYCIPDVSLLLTAIDSSQLLYHSWHFPPLSSSISVDLGRISWTCSTVSNHILKNLHRPCLQHAVSPGAKQQLVIFSSMPQPPPPHTLIKLCFQFLSYQYSGYYFRFRTLYELSYVSISTLK